MMDEFDPELSMMDTDPMLADLMAIDQDVEEAPPEEQVVPKKFIDTYNLENMYLHKLRNMCSDPQHHLHNYTKPIKEGDEFDPYGSVARRYDLNGRVRSDMELYKCDSSLKKTALLEALMSLITAVHENAVLKTTNEMLDKFYISDRKEAELHVRNDFKMKMIDIVYVMSSPPDPDKDEKEEYQKRLKETAMMFLPFAKEALDYKWGRSETLDMEFLPKDKQLAKRLFDKVSTLERESPDQAFRLPSLIGGEVRLGKSSIIIYQSLIAVSLGIQVILSASTGVCVKSPCQEMKAKFLDVLKLEDLKLDLGVLNDEDPAKEGSQDQDKRSLSSHEVLLCGLANAPQFQRINNLVKEQHDDNRCVLVAVDEAHTLIRSEYSCKTHEKLVTLIKMRPMFLFCSATLLPLFSLENLLFSKGFEGCKANMPLSELKAKTIDSPLHRELDADGVPDNTRLKLELLTWKNVLRPNACWKDSYIGVNETKYATVDDVVKDEVMAIAEQYYGKDPKTGLQMPIGFTKSDIPEFLPKKTLDPAQLLQEAKTGKTPGKTLTLKKKQQKDRATFFLMMAFTRNYLRAPNLKLPEDDGAPILNRMMLLNVTALVQSGCGSDNERHGNLSWMRYLVEFFNPERAKSKPEPEPMPKPESEYNSEEDDEDNDKTLKSVLKQLKKVLRVDPKRPLEEESSSDEKEEEEEEEEEVVEQPEPKQETKPKIAIILQAGTITKEKINKAFKDTDVSNMETGPFEVDDRKVNDKVIFTFLNFDQTKRGEVVQLATNGVIHACENVGDAINAIHAANGFKATKIIIIAGTSAEAGLTTAQICRDHDGSLRKYQVTHTIQTHSAHCANNAAKRLQSHRGAAVDQNATKTNLILLGDKDRLRDDSDMMLLERLITEHKKEHCRDGNVEQPFYIHFAMIRGKFQELTTKPRTLRMFGDETKQGRRVGFNKDHAAGKLFKTAVESVHLTQEPKRFRLLEDGATEPMDYTVPFLKPTAAPPPAAAPPAAAPRSSSSGAGSSGDDEELTRFFELLDERNKNKDGHVYTSAESTYAQYVSVVKGRIKSTTGHYGIKFPQEMPPVRWTGTTHLVDEDWWQKHVDKLISPDADNHATKTSFNFLAKLFGNELLKQDGTRREWSALIHETRADGKAPETRADGTVTGATLDAAMADAELGSDDE